MFKMGTVCLSTCLFLGVLALVVGAVPNSTHATAAAHMDSPSPGGGLQTSTAASSAGGSQSSTSTGRAEGAAPRVDGEVSANDGRAVGDLVDTVALPVSGQDVSLAFDGSRIYYTNDTLIPKTTLVSFKPGNPVATKVEVTVTASGTPIDLDAMSFDATRKVLWAVEHSTNKIYTVNRTTGVATFQFDATGNCVRCIGQFKDGLAFDAGNPNDPNDDTIWWSYDVDTHVYRLDTSGTVVESFDASAIHSNLTPFTCALGGGGSSGIAVGGDFLYLARISQRGGSLV